MQRDWDQRARENARFYVATGQENWTDEEFFASGERTVAEEILTDMINICQGKDPKQMRVIEIGCGAGRITRALAHLFGEVHAVDVSGEMVARAREALPTTPNAFVYQNNGKDLSVLPDGPFDFAFSTIVFQHIPSREVIYSYVRKFIGYCARGPCSNSRFRATLRWKPQPDDTWLGVPFSDADAVEMAEKCGFEPRHRHGAGEQYFWLWFFRI